MQNGNSTTNVILLLILVGLVGVGVWYFTMRTVEEPANGVNIELGGGSGE